LKSDLERVYESYDIVLTPTSPEVAWKIWEKSTDPLKMYLSDLYTVPANLAWLPAISVPLAEIDKDGEKLPIGIHLMWKKWWDWDVLNFSETI
jgi:aspartyl-tRNA(Asn)/glutamyl-tRNA(Gln) amidotransferase subunit A